jgi:uncharacterized protein (TIGR02996 family)
VSQPDEIVRRILQDPDADEPRIAFAKWAKHAGDARGEFIEVQLEEARKHRARTYVADWVPYAKQARELLKRYDALWLMPLRDMLDDRLITNPTFYRGFVEDVEMDARTLAEHAAELYAKAPVRHLTLRSVMAYPQVLASPHLQQIGTLSMTSQNLDDSAIEILAASPHARRLRWLDLAVNRITMKGLGAIAASPNLRGLKYVSLRGNDVDDPVDRWTSEGEAIIYTEPRELGRALESKFGPLEWLHAPDKFSVAFPPLVQAAIDA